MSQEQVVQVTTKDPKKVEQGKRLVEYNQKKREKLKKGADSCTDKYEQVSSYLSSQYYGVGVLILIGVIGCTTYYINHKKSSSPPPKIQQYQVPIK